MKRGIIITLALLGVGLIVAGVWFAGKIGGSEREDPRYRGGWDPDASYRLRQSVYLVDVDGNKTLTPPMEINPAREFYSDDEEKRGLPPVEVCVRDGLKREGVVGIVEAGTTLRFERVVRDASAWDATLEYWGQLTSGKYAGTAVILDGINKWDSGDAPRYPDAALVEPVQPSTQPR